MIEIVSSKTVNTLCCILPQKDFDAIRQKLDALKAKAQIEFTYECMNENSDKLYITCLSTDGAIPIVNNLFYS